jgi:hypothetical protein
MTVPTRQKIRWVTATKSQKIESPHSLAEFYVWWLKISSVQILCPSNLATFKRTRMMSSKSGAVADLWYLAIYGKYEDGKVVGNRVILVSSVGILKESLRFYTLYTINSKYYGDIATLTWEFASRCGLTGFLHSVFPVVSLFLSLPFPLLWKHSSSTVMLMLQYRRNILLSII